MRTLLNKLHGLADRALAKSLAIVKRSSHWAIIFFVIDRHRGGSWHTSVVASVEFAAECCGWGIAIGFIKLLLQVTDYF